MMKQLKQIIFILVLMTAGATSVQAGEVGVLLVGKEVSVRELSKNELASIFLGKKTNWEDGTRINIGYMINNSQKMEKFFEEYVGKSHRRFKKYWVKKVFAGYGIAPKLFRDVENAVDFVSRYKGGIAYVTLSEGTKLENVRTIRVGGVSEF
jgi:ABC-type phosphate transport system substrate-binding protein